MSRVRCSFTAPKPPTSSRKPDGSTAMAIAVRSAAAPRTAHPSAITRSRAEAAPGMARTCSWRHRMVCAARGSARAASIRRELARLSYTSALAMPKMKTHSGAKKRFKLTAKGKVRGRHAYSSHILEKKSPKRKRGFRKPAGDLRSRRPAHQEDAGSGK